MKNETKIETVFVNGITMPRSEYEAYMFNRDNIRKCENCPQNRGMASVQNNYRQCGQQNCWIAINTSR